MDITKINQNFSLAIKEVEQVGMITINKYNKPAYVLMTHEFYRNLATYFNGLNISSGVQEEPNMEMTSQYKLHEAMQAILKDAPNRTMRYTDLADKVWSQGLYRKRDGNKASSGQILLRAKNYSNLFEIEDDYYIVLR